MGSDDTTDKLFPMPETRHGAPVIPLPLTRSLREEFLVHRLELNAEREVVLTEIKNTLARIENAAKPERKDPSPDSVARKAQQAGLWALAKSPLVLTALGIIQVAVKAWRPDLSGPLDAIAEYLKGGG